VLWSCYSGFSQLFFFSSHLFYNFGTHPVRGTPLLSPKLTIMLSAYLAATAFARPSFNVRDYGAVGDNATDDTGAFEKAIAAAAGGGQLLVPAGGVFLIRPVNLSSSLEFYIQGGATVAGIADHTKWPVIEAAPSYGQGRDHPGPRYTSLVQQN